MSNTRKQVRAAQYLSWDESHEELEVFVLPIFVPPALKISMFIFPTKDAFLPIPFPRFARAGSLTLNPDVTAFLWCHPENDWRGLIDGDWVVEIPKIGYTLSSSKSFDKFYYLLAE